MVKVCYEYLTESFRILDFVCLFTCHISGNFFLLDFEHIWFFIYAGLCSWFPFWHLPRLCYFRYLFLGYLLLVMNPPPHKKRNKKKSDMNWKESLNWILWFRQTFPAWGADSYRWKEENIWKQNYWHLGFILEIPHCQNVMLFTSLINIRSPNSIAVFPEEPSQSYDHIGGFQS